MRWLCAIGLLGVVSLSAFASDITMDLSLSGNGKPILNARTNLPPKAMLMATLVNPVNRGGDGYFAQVKGEVAADQIARFGPFTKNGERLAPGTYQVTVSTVMAALQPSEIQSFF